MQFEMRWKHARKQEIRDSGLRCGFESRWRGVPAAGGLVGPVVILIAPPPGEQDRRLLAEAPKFNAFSVLNEPVEVKVALEVMARAMRRAFAGLWPGGGGGMTQRTQRAQRAQRQ